MYTMPDRVDGGMEEMLHMWMHCELCRPEAYLPYVGGHMASRAPQREYFLHAVGQPTRRKAEKEKKEEKERLTGKHKSTTNNVRSAVKTLAEAVSHDPS
jgi:hypothetical protein